jgi:hypothetical protein
MAEIAHSNETTYPYSTKAVASESNLVLQKIWPPLISRADCALCFILSGFFYLVVCIVMMIGFEPGSSGLPVESWWRLQPFFTLCYAVGLTLIGALVFLNRQITHRLARLGIMIYFSFTLVNGILSHWFPGESQTVAGWLLFSVGAALLGIFLLVTLHRYQAGFPFQQSESRC